MMFTKLLTGLTLTGLMATAAPAFAHGPEPRVAVSLDFGNVHVALGRPAPIAYRREAPVDYRLLNEGVHVERVGLRLIDEGRALQWRGYRFHDRHMVRRGERMEARGNHLVQRGRSLQYQARDAYAVAY